MADDNVREIIYLADILEQCDFTVFWSKVESNPDLFRRVTGFYDSIRKFVCHVVGITFQTIEKQYLAVLLGNVDGELMGENERKFIYIFWYFVEKTVQNWVKKNGWKDENGLIFISNQDDNIKTKNITEKIEFESLAGLMAACLN